jgi:hypothetical protein
MFFTDFLRQSLLVVTGLLCLTPVYARVDCEPVPKAVYAYIAAVVKQDRGDESCVERQIVKGRINGDKVNDMAVVFHVGGPCFGDKESTPGSCTNGHVSYLAVFMGPDYKKVAKLRVGLKATRAVRISKVEKGVIHGEARHYAADDARCCPSIKNATTFVYEKGVVVERGSAEGNVRSPSNLDAPSVAPLPASSIAPVQPPFR